MKFSLCLKHLLNKCTFCVFGSFIILYFMSSQLTLLKWLNNKTERVRVNLEYVVVHVDLKGAPPKLTYLKSILPTMKRYGANAILLEYEDMFPYEGGLRNLSARHCYDKEELQDFLIEVDNAGIEIIPFVQTFGHMEFALKLKEFMHLRENKLSPTSICPSRPESIELIRDILEQVITFHKNIKPLKHILIGFDEVFDFNMCRHCRKKNWTPINIFMGHLQEVNGIVRTFSPTTTVLIWDDMLRKKTMRLNQNFSLSVELKNIEPVYWNYGTAKVSHVNLYLYHKLFRNIWIASAFKGAESQDSIFPNIKARFQNNYNWLGFTNDYKFGGETEVYKFKGIILTGWSRYSHMQPICDLLPLSMPSLIVNLMLIKTFREGIDKNDIYSMKPCDFFNKYLRDEFDKNFNLKYNKCSLNEIILDSKIYNNFNLRSYDTMLLDLQYTKLYTKLNILCNKQLKDNIATCKLALRKLTAVEKIMKTYMTKYYENNTIDEYITEKIYGIRTQIIEYLKILQSYSKIYFWGSRPFTLE